ncbi:roadblock/LC7 domain-containing protein [Geomesophilobacter sediminis]|uniref:Roadblock/LC7 domain-containing protein n=1 Tax=Geomesophilobacter sediminis TaxID=2798584 RepID=A0A8J7M3B5_9BACT|nr:roadblock/LC7 domain-containing protein [Geomesophilobacter sediminis]MBJ6727458.1 roadblock/LC7 domain-containing protein [Geomesophilobacter sediminis]
MAFKDILREVVEKCSGARAAVMLGFDGITVDEYLAEGANLDLQQISAEYGALLKDLDETVGALKEGNLQEVTVATDLSRVVLRRVDEDYFVALLLDGAGNVGKGRYLLQCAAIKMREELD